MFPYKIDSNIKKIPIVTLILIIICTVFHFVSLQYKLSNHFLKAGLVPLDFVYVIIHPGKETFAMFFTLVFSFFLHTNFIHLASNMWYLWLFGSALENNIGKFKFFILYFISGIISMIIQISSNPLSTIPVVGASGAIAGVMGMYLIINPFSKIIFWIPPFFSLKIFSSIFLLIWFWIQWENLASQNGFTSNIAWWSHIGGFISGMIYGLKYLISKKGKKK